MRIPAYLKTAGPLALWLVFFALDAQGALQSDDILDNVLARYSAAASGWAGVITIAATWLFWTLVLISMVWTFGMMALRKADIGEFFAEFVRFTIFTGFFWWLLINGPAFANSIIQSLRQLAGNATGLGNALSPSGVVDVGFLIFDTVISKSSAWSPVDSGVGIIIAAIILVVLALIGVNMLLLLVSAWILAYGGVFFLGFGGSRWTSDFAINYYKTVLAVAAQLMTMVLLVGIGKTFLDDYYALMSKGVALGELGIMLIVAIILLALVNKVPTMVAGIITGASVGGAGIGTLGAGAALGAAALAAAAAAMGGAAMREGATAAAGGAQALMAAFMKANMNVDAGTDILSAFNGAYSAGGNSNSSTSGDSTGGTDGVGTGNTPFASAAGFDGGSSSSNFGNIKAGGEDAKDGESAESKPDKSMDGQTINEGSQTGKVGLIGKVGRIAVDATANLAKGTVAVAKAKAANIKESANEQIADTTGGKIAAAIKQGNDAAQAADAAEIAARMAKENRGAAGTGRKETQVPNQIFSDNSLANSHEADPESEVAAFRDRDNNIV